MGGQPPERLETVVARYQLNMERKAQSKEEVLWRHSKAISRRTREEKRDLRIKEISY